MTINRRWFRARVNVTWFGYGTEEEDDKMEEARRERERKSGREGGRNDEREAERQREFERNFVAEEDKKNIKTNTQHR